MKDWIRKQNLGSAVRSPYKGEMLMLCRDNKQTRSRSGAWILGSEDGLLYVVCPADTNQVREDKRSLCLRGTQNLNRVNQICTNKHGEHSKRDLWATLILPNLHQIRNIVQSLSCDLPNPIINNEVINCV